MSVDRNYTIQNLGVSDPFLPVSIPTQSGGDPGGNSLLQGSISRTSTAFGRTATVKAGEDIRPALESLKSAGGGTLILLAGVHQLSYFLAISSNIKIVGEGPGTTILDFNGGDYYIYSDGDQPGYSAGTISITKGTKTVTGVSTTFLSNTFERGKSAILVEATNRWYLIDSVNSNTSLTLFDEYTGATIAAYAFHRFGIPLINIEISGLTIRNNITTNDLLYFSNVVNLKILDCWFRTAGNDGIDLRASNNVIIEGCRFDDNTNSGINLGSCNTVAVSDCSFVNNSDGVETSSCIDVSIARCSFFGNSFFPLEINGSDRVLISDCTLFNNYAGITVSGFEISIRNTVVDRATNYYGIYVSADVVNISACTVVDSDLDGIYINNTSSNVVVSGNSYGGNGFSGGTDVFVDDAAGNIVILGSEFNSGYEGNGDADGMVGGYASKRKVNIGINYRTSLGDIPANSLVVHHADQYGTSFRRPSLELTTVRGDKYVQGKSEPTTRAYTSTTKALTSGQTVNLKVSGRDDIAAGDFLTAYNEEGIACKAQPGDMVFAMAWEAYTADNSSGVIDAWLFEWRFPMPNLVGVMSVKHAAVGNVGAGEDDLITYTLPAGVLAADGETVRIKAWGTTVNNANTKTLKLYFGSAVILTNALTISAAGKWVLEAVVVRTGTDIQDYMAELRETGTGNSDIENGTATQDDGASIIIKCTGTATSNDDIKQEGMIVELINT